MSTDLTTNEFPEKSSKGAFNWLFEGFRKRMRDAAKFIRMEAAWRTWPSVHAVAKGLQEQLTTAEDIEAVKQDSLHAYAARLAEVFPSGQFPHADDPKAMMENLCYNIGLDPDEPDAHGIVIDDVLALYRAQYAPAAASNHPSHDKI